jgi:hypothetical protein
MATSPPPPPLTHKCELGVVLVYFTHDSRHVITATSSCSQTRGGGGSSFFSLRMTATSPPPPPLAHKREVGVVPCSFHSRPPPRHHHHPPSLANASWGCFLVCFARDGRHITAPTPSRSQTRGGGDFSFFSLMTAATSLPPPPLAGKHKVGVVLGSFCLRQLPHHHPHPPLARKREVGGGSLFVSLETTTTSSPPPPLACKCELGVFLGLFCS